MKISLKNRMKKAFGVSVLSMLFCMPAFSNDMFLPYQTMNPYASSKIALEENVAIVPSGTEIPVTTVSDIDTGFLVQGQNVQLMLSRDYYYDGKFIAPLGSTISGTVVKVKSAAENPKNVCFEIQFTNMHSPYGQTIPLSAKLKADLKSGLLNDEKLSDFAKLTTTGDIVIPVNVTLLIKLEQPIMINASNIYQY